MNNCIPVSEQNKDNIAPLQNEVESNNRKTTSCCMEGYMCYFERHSLWCFSPLLHFLYDSLGFKSLYGRDKFLVLVLKLRFHKKATKAR